MKMATEEMVTLFKYCKINKYFNTPEAPFLKRVYNETLYFNGESFAIKCEITDSDIRDYKKAQRVGAY